MENDELKDLANNEEEKREDLTKDSLENNEEVQLEKEETKEDTIDEDTNDLEEIVEPEPKKPIKFWNSLLGSVLDQLIVIILSAIILMIFNFLIKYIGYRVVMPEAVLIIIYGIINCLYLPILSKTKLNETVGQKVFNA